MAKRRGNKESEGNAQVDNTDLDQQGDEAWNASREAAKKSAAGKTARKPATAAASTEEHEAGDDLDDDDVDAAAADAAAAAAVDDDAALDDDEDDEVQAGADGGADDSPLRAYFREKGFDVDGFENDDELLEAVDEEVREARSLADRYGKLEPQIAEYTASAAEFQEWKAARQKSGDSAAGSAGGDASRGGDRPADSARAAEEPAKPKWGEPEVGELTESILRAGVKEKVVTEDPTTGLLRTTDPSLVAHVQKWNERESWRRTTGRRMLSDPVGLLREAGLDAVLSERDAQIAELKKAVEELKGGYQKDRSGDKLEQFFQEHAAEFFVDSDPEKGLTDHGQAYNAAFREAQTELGITDTDKAHAYALKWANATAPVQNGTAGTGQAAANGNGKHASGNGSANGAGKSVAERKKEKQRLFLSRSAERHGKPARTGSRHARPAKAASREAAVRDMDEDALWNAERAIAESELT